MRRPGSIEALAELEVQRAERRGAVARRLLRELAPHSRTMVAVLLLMLVSAATLAGAPYLVGRAIDHDITHRDGWGLVRTLAVLLGVYVVGAAAQRAVTHRIGLVGQRVLAAMRGRLFAHLQRLPLTFFDRRPIGDLMSRLVTDVDTLNQFFSQSLNQLLGALFGLAGVVIAMFALNPGLALACSMMIPAVLFTTWFFAARARKAYRKARETVGDVTADLQQEIVGVRQAQAFNRTSHNIEKFRGRNARNRDANVAAVGVTSAFSPAVELLSTVATALVIGYGGWLVLGGSLTVGALAAFLLYMQQFFRPLQFAAASYTLMQSALAGAERVFGILDEPVEPEDAPGAIELQRATGRIEFERVSFGYDAARPVLHEVSFTVEPGKSVALVGKTGAGKTTVASLIPRLYDPASGAVRIDGRDLREVTRASLRKQTAMVLQEPFLFSGTIAENIAYGRPGATQAEIEAAATAVHAHEFISALPKGYQSQVGEAGATLSQGQRQLLAFARAVLADPAVLILDEATANIDTKTEALIQLALGKLLQARTSVIIAHRLNTIRNADEILVLEQGRIVERGNHRDLVARGGAYAALVERSEAAARPAARGSTR